MSEHQSTVEVEVERQGEATRLPVRIYCKPHENGCILITQWGRLRGSYLHEDLNKESEETQKEIGAEIPFSHIDLDGDVLPLVNLTKAVQGYMRRGTVAAGQKNGRKRACTANPLPTPRKRAYKPRGPGQPQISLEKLGLIDQPSPMPLKQRQQYSARRLGFKGLKQRRLRSIASRWYEYLRALKKSLRTLLLT